MPDLAAWLASARAKVEAMEAREPNAPLALFAFVLPSVPALLDVAEAAAEVDGVSLALGAWVSPGGDLDTLVFRKALAEQSLRAALVRLAKGGE